MPKVEIALDMSAVESICRAQRDAALETIGELRTEIVAGQVMPFDTGTLQDSIGAVDQFEDGNELHTTLCIGDTPYARRLYFHPEYNFQTVNNHNAQGEWAKRWLEGGDQEEFVPDTFRNRMEDKLR